MVADVLSPAPVSSRHVSAGVRPDPGSTSTRPAWWGAEDWTQLEVPAAVWAHRDVCRAHHVDPDTVIAIARGMAGYADHRTGRDCRPTNARLVALLRVSLSTVQRARRVLKALGLVVELVRGRSVMTRAERLQAWRRGSSHRRVAAEFALCSRRGRRIRSWSSARPVERDTPPSALGDNGYLARSSSSLRTTTGTRKAAPRPTAARRGATNRVDPRSRRLAEAARRRLGWLTGVSARRITPALARFAWAGWTEDDVVLAVQEALGARGWLVPSELAQPAAYLAALLRPLDPEERPTVLEEHRRESERLDRAYRRQLALGAPCPHGRPAGDVPSPGLKILACPQCRAAAAPAEDSWP